MKRVCLLYRQVRDFWLCRSASAVATGAKRDGWIVVTGLRQIETLYKKLHQSACTRQHLKLDPAGRSDIFEKIMVDVERLLKKIKKLPPESEAFEKADNEIRLLLMKEIQVIIDDYVLCQRSGTVQHWVAMYGDIQYYINNYYRYRDGHCTDASKSGHRYGFYDGDHLL